MLTAQWRQRLPEPMPTQTELLARIMERIASGSGSATAAQAAAAWRVVFDRFAPLFGPLSTHLVFERSVAVCDPAFPWLPHTSAPQPATAAFDAFVDSLDGRTPREIEAVNSALLDTYTKQLEELIGARLAARFLDSAFPPKGADTNI